MRLPYIGARLDQIDGDVRRVAGERAAERTARRWPSAQPSWPMIAGPGLLWNTALTRASIFGMVYDGQTTELRKEAARHVAIRAPEADDRRLQARSDGELGAGARAPQFGRLRRTSQKFEVVCPVPMPALKRQTTLAQAHRHVHAVEDL